MAYTKPEIDKLCRGRTSEQQSVIKYFLSGGGCLSRGLSDAQYESMVMAKAQSIDFKKKALEKIGLDESQVKEIQPVHFEGYYVSENRAYYAKLGRDGKWRSSAYQISWLFFSSTQVYVYQYTFNMNDDNRKESTEEYFYKDITNFSTSTDTVEKEVFEKTSGGCGGGGEAIFGRQNVESNSFILVVPGYKFHCSMEQSAYTEKAIQGMKAKLREKKG